MDNFLLQSVILFNFANSGNLSSGTSSCLSFPAGSLLISLLDVINNTIFGSYNFSSSTIFGISFANFISG